MQRFRYTSPVELTLSIVFYVYGKNGWTDCTRVMAAATHARRRARGWLAGRLAGWWRWRRGCWLRALASHVAAARPYQ
eukprot:COSAG01_NODE_2076_length_8486_cov_41.323000_11_plen_78_part_00